MQQSPTSVQAVRMKGAGGGGKIGLSKDTGPQNTMHGNFWQFLEHDVPRFEERSGLNRVDKSDVRFLCMLKLKQEAEDP